jgi:hypothetical protein
MPHRRTRLASVALALFFATPASLVAQEVIKPVGGAGVAEAPPAPERVWAAQTGPREVTLVWDTVAGATGFVLYQGSSERDAKVVARLAKNVSRYVVPTARITPATSGFWIATTGVAGRTSPRVAFNRVSVVTAPLADPAAPATVTATASGPGQVTVRWSAVPGASAYQIARSVRPNGFISLCAICSTIVPEFVDRATTDGAVTVYSVKAMMPDGRLSKATTSNEVTPTGTAVAIGGGAAAGSGTPSTGTGGTGTGGTGTGSTATDTTRAGSTTTAAPPPPTSLSARAAGPMDVALSWAGSAGATSYQLSRSVCGSQNEAVNTMGAGASVLSWTDNIPWATINMRCPQGSSTGGVRYLITASGPGGASQQVLFPPVLLTFGQVVIGTTRPQTPGKVNYTVRSDGGGSVVMRWAMSPAATSYRIDRSVGGGAFTRIATVGRVDNYTDTTSGIIKQNPKYRIYAVNANGESEPLTLP